MLDADSSKQGTDARQSRQCRANVVDNAAAVFMISPVPGRGTVWRERRLSLIAGVTFTHQAEPPRFCVIDTLEPVATRSVSVQSRTEFPPCLNQSRRMLKKSTRVAVPPVVAAVVRPVNPRLSRMEDLLIEMRGVQDVQLRKLNKLLEQVGELMERRGRVRR